MKSLKWNGFLDTDGAMEDKNFLFCGKDMTKRMPPGNLVAMCRGSKNLFLSTWHPRG